MAKEEGIKWNSKDIITYSANLNQKANMNVLKCIWNSMVRHENKLGDFFELQGYALLDPRWNLIQVCGIVFSYNIVCRGKERYVEEERSGCISKCCFVLKKLAREETVHLSKCIYTTTYGGEYSVRVLFQKFISVTEVFSLLGFLPIGLLLTYPRCQGIQNYVSRWGVFSIQFIRIVFESPQMKVTKLLIDLSNICNSQMQLDIHYGFWDHLHRLKSIALSATHASRLCM